jgi:peptidoglycan/LPS O-acetylase OafA/YrhL
MTGLTSLRGVAAWLVVLYHLRMYAELPGPEWFRFAVDHGYLAVDLFFLMSGFILMHVHGREFGGKEFGGRGITRAAYLGFLRRRLARIYPLHLLVLLAYATIPLAHIALGGGLDPYVAERFDPGAFVAQALLIHVVLSLGHTWNVPSWSIGVEWFAYVLFPRIAAAGSRLSGPLADAIGFVLPLALVAALFRAWGQPSLDVLDATSLPRGILEFAAGCFLYRLHRRGAWAALAVPLAALPFFAALWALDGQRDYHLFPCLAGLLVALTARAESPIARALSFRPLAYLGEISYSTYMIHFYVRDAFKLLFVDESLVMRPGVVALYLAAVLGGSMLTYHLVEVPSRGWLRGRAAPPAGAAGKATAPG